MKKAKKRKSAPVPLLSPRKPVEWWFIFKLNSAEEPGDPKPPGTNGLFDVKGWKRPAYEKDGKKFSQHYIVASSENPTLRKGKGIVGATRRDPLGATFGQVYFGSYYYVIWNDQFYGDPRGNGNSPWGHSKGMVAWNDDGEGLVLQVSTPSWPASGSSAYPRKTDGNTLGYVKDDDIEVSQHFFALKLSKDDLIEVLAAMKNASVVTARKKKQVVDNGGPEDARALVESLGKRTKKGKCTNVVLSSGVRLISKPSSLAVPPWQLVSAQLGGVDLRVASWWARPKIYSTTRESAKPRCWSRRLGTPGAVDIAISGTWRPRGGPKLENLGLTGGLGANKNHAKFGVSTSGGKTFSIFGDMNQQGALCKGYSSARQKCSSSQNGRGGLFYVLEDAALFESLTGLLQGDSAPTSPPKRRTKRAKK